MDPQHAIDIGAAVNAATSTKSAGDIPTTDIINDTIEKAKVYGDAIIPTNELSSTGQTIASDLTKTLSDTQRLLLEKNRNDLFQKAAAGVQEIVNLQDTTAGKQLLTKLTENSDNNASYRMDFYNISNNSLNLVRNAIQSSDFISLLLDFVKLAQQVTLCGFEQAKEGLEEEKKNVEHKEEKKTVEHEKFKEQPKDKKTVEHKKFKEQPKDTREQPKDTQEQPKDTQEEIKSFAEAAKETVKEKLSPITSTSTATEKESPSLLHKETSSLKPDKDRLTNRFVQLLEKVREKKEYQDLVNALGSTAQYWIYKRKNVVKSLNTDEQKLLDQIKDNVDKVFGYTRQLVENFANCSIEDLAISWDDLSERVTNDNDAHNWANDAKELIQRCFTDENYNKDEINNDAGGLVDRLKDLSNEYRPRVEHFLSQLSYYADRMKRDPLTRQWADDLNNLTLHLFYDKQGRTTLKPELLADLQAIIPAILRGLSFIKIPNIELHEPGLDFKATDIIINVRDLAPNHLSLTMVSDVPEENESEAATNSIEFEMTKIHAEAQDIHFSVSKSGIPPLDDTGLADFRIYEEGMQIALSLQPVFSKLSVIGDEKKIAAGLQIVKCVCKLEHFDLNIHGSGHDWMYYLLGPYVRRLVRGKIEEAVTDYFMNFDLVATIPIPESNELTQQQKQQQQQESLPPTSSQGKVESQFSQVSIH